MAVVRTLGKNTLGDNDKMKVAMRDYDMSTHDISTIFRSSVGVGMLVPFCKILCQKGDIIDNIVMAAFREILQFSQEVLVPWSLQKLDISSFCLRGDRESSGYFVLR